MDNLIVIDQEILTKTGLLIETTVNKTNEKPVTSDELLKLLEYYTAKIEKSKTNIYNNKQTINQLNVRIAEIRKRLQALLQ